MKVDSVGLSRRRLLQGFGGTLGILGLAACGTVATAPAADEEAMAPKEEAKQEAPAPAEPTEVEFLIGPFAGRSVDAMDAWLANFHEKNPSIQIKLIIAEAGTNYQQQIATFVAAGANADVLHMSGGHFTYAAEGVLVNLDDHIKADTNFDIAAYYPRVTEFYRVPEGGQWALPWNHATEGVYYNKTLLAEAGLDEPGDDWTWDDLREMARVLTKDANNDNEPESWGVEFRLVRIDHVLRSFGGGFLADDNTRSVITEPGSIAALQYLADLMLKDRTHPYPALGWRNGFSEGKIAISFLPEWAAVRLASVEGLDFDVGLMPQGPEGRYTFFGSGGASMFSTSDAQDASWEVLKWFTNFDGGEWGMARAISFPSGSPSALIAANEYFWNEFLTKPENRTRFLQNPDFAVVPFGGSWDGRFFDQSARQALPQIWEGTKSVEEVARELDAMWVARLEETGRHQG